MPDRNPLANVTPVRYSGVMTKAEVLARRLRNAATAETEAAYIDRNHMIRFDVLLAIAGGVNDPQELAEAALKTLDRDVAWIEMDDDV